MIDGGAGAARHAPAPPPALGGHITVGVLNTAVGDPVYVSPAESATAIPLTFVPLGSSTVSEKSPDIGVTIDKLPKSLATPMRKNRSNVKPLPQLGQFVMNVNGAFAAPDAGTKTKLGGKSGLAGFCPTSEYSK